MSTGSLGYATRTCGGIAGAGRVVTPGDVPIATWPCVSVTAIRTIRSCHCIEVGGVHVKERVVPGRFDATVKPCECASELNGSSRLPSRSRGSPSSSTTLTEATLPVALHVNVTGWPPTIVVRDDWTFETVGVACVARTAPLNQTGFSPTVNSRCPEPSTFETQTRLTLESAGMRTNASCRPSGLSEGCSPTMPVSRFASAEESAVQMCFVVASVQVIVPFAFQRGSWPLKMAAVDAPPAVGTLQRFP